jgi:hypothetical protein
MRTFTRLVLAVLCLSLPIAPRASAQKDTKQEKLYVDQDLKAARDNLKGRLEDKELKAVFVPDNTAVTAITLEVIRRGEEVRVITVYATRKGQMGKKFVKSLDDPKDADFRTLVKVLRLGG